jgi:ribosomal protein L37E
MALITCPECGKENLSSSAASCPNCGFDLKAYQQKLDDEKAAAEAEQKAQENLEAQRKADDEARQRILDSIPDPTPYGKIPAYIIIGVIGVLFAVAAHWVFILIAAAVAGAYWYKSNTEYKNFQQDPVTYKLGKAAENATGGVSVAKPSSVNPEGNMFCPKCGSEDISRQVFQENKGSRTTTHTQSKYKEQGHGCLWWLTIGWWWWFVDLMLWIFAFFPRLILRLFAAPFKKKKYKGKSTSVSQTVNDISYRTICTCNKCGHTWG